MYDPKIDVLGLFYHVLVEASRLVKWWGQNRLAVNCVVGNVNKHYKSLIVSFF